MQIKQLNKICGYVCSFCFLYCLKRCGALSVAEIDPVNDIKKSLTLLRRYLGKFEAQAPNKQDSSVIIIIT